MEKLENTEKQGGKKEHSRYYYVYICLLEKWDTTGILCCVLTLSP